MAVHREIVTNALTSDRIKQIIEEREIQLVSYSDTYEPDDPNDTI
ncbi:MAG: hypothetical protein PVJ60_02130 [Phycisphaerales bacterium]